MAGTTIVRPGTHERTIRWMKNEIQSLKNRLSQAGMGEIPGGAYEPALGSPLVDHYVLESTIAGVRAWVASGVGPDLTAIEALTGEGLAVRTAADTWALREIAVSGNGLNAVTNPKGIAGNPTLSLNIGTGAAQVAAGDHAHSGVYEPVIAAGTTAQYWRGDKSWQTLNQAAVVGLTTADSPAFVTVKCSGLTDGYIPYHVSDAVGLANSILVVRGSEVRYFSSYKGANSDGRNLFIGSTGEQCIGEAGATYKGSCNVGLGYAALYYNTTGYFNVGLGYAALQYNTTGYANVGLGYAALYYNTTGYYNVGLGCAALHYNTTGYANLGLGYAALHCNTTGYYNLGLGHAALYDNTTGYANLGLGCITLYDLTDGYCNTAVGFNTGRGIVTGTNNTILGANISGLAPALSNNIILANGSGSIKAQHDGANWQLTGDILLASGQVIKINDTQVLGARVIDARIDDAINSGDATTDGVIDALRDAMIAHGLIAAA